MTKYFLMPVKRIHVGKLKENKKNGLYFKTDEDSGQLFNDIKKRGIMVPLIAQPDGTLLAGHRRLLIAKTLGMKDVPVQKTDRKLTDQEETEFIIKDNLLRRQLSFDERKQLYEKVIKNLNERILHSVQSGIGISSKEISEKTGIGKNTIQYDLSRMKHDKRKEENERLQIECENEKAVAIYKKAITRATNTAMVEKEITIKKLIELTETALERMKFALKCSEKSKKII